MIYDGSKTVATAGTRVALASVRTPASWVHIQSKTANTGSIYVGGSTVTSLSGIELPSALDSHQLPPIGDILAYDLQDIYVDAAVNGEGVKFVYSQR